MDWVHWVHLKGVVDRREVGRDGGDEQLRCQVTTRVARPMATVFVALLLACSRTSTPAGTADDAPAQNAAAHIPSAASALADRADSSSLTLGEPAASAGGSADAREGQTGARPGVGAATADFNYEGTYRSGNNEIKLLKVDATRAKVDVFATHRDNSGFASGGATVDKNGATYADNTFGHCTIRFNFASGNRLNVTTQQGADECGFGFGVLADGAYAKVSSARPTIGVDPRIEPAASAPPSHSVAAPPKAQGKADSCYDSSGPVACPGDDEFVCARDDCVWRVPPGGGCDSPGNCIHHRAASTPAGPKAPSGAAPSQLAKGATGKCMPGEQGGVGYFCKNGYKYPN